MSSRFLPAVCAAVACTALIPTPLHAQSLTTPAAESADTYPIDLPTALRLSDAQNLDIQIARELLSEARGNHLSAVEQFLPWITAGAAFRRHEGRTQAVDGELLDVDKQQITAGGTITAQVNLGDAVYRELAARQLVVASSERVDAQRQDSTLAAAQGYFDLLKSKLLVDVVQEAMETSARYGSQIGAAVEAGVAFKGDQLRVQTQTDRYRVESSRAKERYRTAAARLAQILHLDPTVELVPLDDELVPIPLVDTDVEVERLVQQALDTRPELAQSRAVAAAARNARNGAIYGPLIPAVTAQAFVGELGGGLDDSTGDFGSSDDYYVGLEWRIGPGGLLDVGRINTSRARLRGVELGVLKIQDEISRQVVEGYTRVRALADQIAASRQTLAAATETFRLTRARKQLGVGIVLEDIQAQQELESARGEYVTAISEFNKAQYLLSKWIGTL
jgi:outer membrane protein TolC